MLDTVASNKTAQVTLGVLQKPQSTIVNYYCIVNCYYFVSLVVPSVMTCIATLSAVMRWVFVHYLSGEQVLRLITELTEWQGHWDKRCRACQKMDSSQACCKKYCKRFATGSVTLVGKDELSINCFFFFFFFSLLLVTPQTHPRRHTYTYMRDSPFPVLLCSQSSFPINPVYLRQLFEVILYGSRLHLFCGALNGHFWVVNNVLP